MTELVAARRYEALASSVVGRPIRVAWSDGEPTSTDGTLIELDPAHADRARDAVLVQSALLAGGALEPERVRRLRGRPRRIDRHLVTEVPICLARLAAVMPPVRLPAPTGTAEPWWGTIRPDRLLRTAAIAARDDTPLDLIGEPSDTSDEPDPGGETANDRSSRLGRRTADQGKRPRRRRRSSTSGGRSDLGEASALRAVLATTTSAIPRMAQIEGRNVLVVDPPKRAGAVASYPEWDERRDGYRADWCQIHEVTAPAGGSADVSHTPGAAVRRRLARVHLDLHAFRRQPAGSDLDLDATIEHRIAVRSGADQPAHVYRDLRRSRRDLGVLVLVDGSGSGGRQPSDGRSITERQLEAAAALVEGFEALGDRVACHVFRSHGRRRVELASIKGFDQRLGTTVRTRLSGIRPEGFTRLGAAVRHGAHLLISRSGSRRWLLVVLSDGFPFDSGYEGSYAAADVSRALAEARRAGVGALCLGIGATTPDRELEAVFGTSTYATGARIDDLGQDLADLVRAALDGADRSRRLT